MAASILTQAKLKRLLDYNLETGLFLWKISKSGIKNIKAGTLNSKGYIKIVINGKQYFAHRLAWMYVYGEFPNFQLDHINGIKSDNRISNLRIAEKSINNENLLKCKSTNKSGYLGVTKRKGFDDFRADIRVNKKKIYLGIYKDAESAYFAYLQAKRKYHIGNNL